MKPDDILARARKAFENLNARERLLLGAMGGIFALLLIVVPLFMIGSSIDELEESNQSISDVLRDIRRAAPTLAERQAEREATARLYERKAPALGSFVERKANSHSLTIREVNDSPEQTLGDYTRRHVRVSFSAVRLLPVVELMTDLENSRLPVAIDRILIEHFREGDQYNVQLGVAAYDAEGAELGAPPAPSPPVRGGRGARRRGPAAMQEGTRAVPRGIPAPASPLQRAAPAPAVAPPTPDDEPEED